MAQTKKKTIWKRWYMIVLYCFVGLIVIGSLLPDSDNSETNINSQVNVEQETLTIEQQMEKSVVEILGSSNRKVDRLVEFDYLDNLFPQDEGRIAVANIRFNINDNLNKNYIRGGALMDSADLFEHLYANYPDDLTAVQIMGFYPLSDSYGKEEDVAVLKISIKKETADKINWDNFNSDNFPIVADSYYIHPALSD